MAEQLIIQGANKEEKYQNLLPQIEALLQGEPDVIANMANLTAALKQTFHFFWIGFYLVKEQQLVLGPFQGSLACTRIGYGKGVCGFAWKQQKTVIVADVEQFEGHIACNAQSKSEIVVPVFDAQKKVVAVLDIDEDAYAHFDETDQHYLEKIVEWLTPLF
ncbi:MAG: GAF domain-containing protein [Bacteroidetes bacterium]|nr:GAF domain-containing protein [Bacteroidota bacterium]